MKYLQGYAPELIAQAQKLVDDSKLASYLRKRYPKPHDFRSDRALADYVVELKRSSLKNAPSLNRVSYCNKISPEESLLGVHVFRTRNHGGKAKADSEIKIATLFRSVPEEFLRMIVVHELAHFREKDHNRAFYKLCQNMEPNYFQLEFDLRLYLTLLDTGEQLY